MPKPPHALERDFVHTSLQFLERQPWQQLPNDALFLLRVPTEEHPLVASVMGAAGMEFGLSLARGERAFQQFLDMILGSPDSEDLATTGDLLSVSFDPLHTLPEEFRRLLQLAGHSPRREKRVPIAFASPPYEATRPAKRAELRTLLWILRGILSAMDAGEFKPFLLDEQGRKIFELQIDGKLKRPDVTARVVDWPAASIETPMLALLPKELSKLPRHEERWLVTCIQLPAMIEGDDRLTSGFLVAVEGGLVLGSQIGMGSDLGQGQTLLIQAFHGECQQAHQRGLPREIIFGDRRLHDSLSPALSGLDIRTHLDLEHPELVEMSNGLQAALGSREPTVEEEGLQAWREASQRVTEWLMAEAIEKDLITPRAMKHYFGSLEDGERILDEMERLGPYPAFLDWLITDYRATKRSQTMLEKLLKKGNLEPEMRQLLEARVGGLCSIFRVDSRKPGTSLEVEDLFTGQPFTLHDTQLSTCELDGCFIPLRLIQVEGWTFPFFAGPPLHSMQVPSAVQSLEDAGAGSAAENLEREPHLLGSLWSHVLHARPPQLQNTDGDVFEPQSARFLVADARALLRALEQRDDVHHDRDMGRWTWFREGTTTGFGDTTALAHMTLIDDQLLVEINSDARCERVRAWLERIKGVSFESLTRHDPNPANAPLDDSLPSPEPEALEPELLRELETMLHEHCRRWVDQPIPMLGNRTPRQAYAKPEGRRKVEQLVRSMPPLHTPGGSIQVPREEILRELGIRE